MDDFEIETKIRLNEKWGVSLNWGWHPILSIPNLRKDSIRVFQQTYFAEEADAILKDILASSFGIEDVYIFEEQEGYEKVRLSEADFYYSGMEKIITDDEANFCLYGSHESSFTIGSKDILSELLVKWQNFGRRIWTTPFYE